MNVWSSFLHPTVLLDSKLPNEIIEITQKKSNRSNFSHQFQSGSPFMSFSEVLVTTISDLSRCTLHHMHHFSTCSWLSILCWSAGRTVWNILLISPSPLPLPSWVIWRGNIQIASSEVSLKGTRASCHPSFCSWGWAVSHGPWCDPHLPTTVTQCSTNFVQKKPLRCWRGGLCRFFFFFLTI